MHGAEVPAGVLLPLALGLGEEDTPLRPLRFISSLCARVETQLI